MFLFSYTAAVLSILCFGTAALVFVKKGGSALARYFAFYIFFVGVWVGSNSLADLAKQEAALRFWTGMALVGGCFFVSCYLAFAEFFTTERPVSWIKKIIFFLPSVIFSILGFTAFYVTATFFPPDSPTQVMLGSMNYAVLAFTMIGMTYGLVRPLAALRSAPSIKKWQTIYISIGFFATMAGAITFAILLPSLGELRFFTLGSQFTIVAIALTAYAIFRHNLLDIRIVIQRSIIYSCLLAIILGVYVLLLSASRVVLDLPTATTTAVSGVLTAILGILGAPFIKRWFEKVTDHIFFKDKYDYAAALRELSQVLNKSLDAQEIAREAALKLQRIFKVADVRVLPVEENSVEYGEQVPSGSISQAIVLDGRTIGTIRLGRKLSGDPYSEEDLRLLETFSYQAAVALEKARLYLEVKKHSVELEEKVKERTAQIKELQERQNRMMIDISHGLQTPLTIAKGQIDSLKSEMSDNGRLDTLERSVDATSKIIYDFLDLVRLEIDREDLSRAPLDLSQLVHGVLEYLDILAEQKGITISKDIQPGVTILGNKSEITNLLTNLLSNAFKYMSPKREKKIFVSLGSAVGTVRLVVEDTGIGIAPKDLAHIFTRFYRAPNQEHSEMKGSGLGLSIVKRIVEDHDGTIEAASEPGRGTKFTVTFPAL